MWESILEFMENNGILDFIRESGIYAFFQEGGWKYLIMIAIALGMLYLAIFKGFEPYLLVPIAMGMLLVNLPGSNLFITDPVTGAHTGLLGFLYIGVESEIYPCLIFIGIGATTDFGPLIANPKSMLLGAAAQIGIFITFLGALFIFGYTEGEAASIGIIGGADGPTAIILATNLAPSLLGPISLAAYSYMSLVPVIQPPIIRLLTTKKERQIKMTQLRPVGKLEKLLFPIVTAVICILIVPSCAPLIGMLMLGNLIKESGVVPNLVKTVSNGILYTVSILLGLCVGATASAEVFLTGKVIGIFILGIVSFAVATATGVLGGKLMCWTSHGKVNPMIGAAGVSALPMSARVVQLEGQREDPTNFLLMHAMGPNVAGQIGVAIVGGLLLSLFGA